MKRPIGSVLLTLLLLLSLSLAARAADEVRVAVIDTGVSAAVVAPANLAPGENYILPGRNTEDRVGHGTAIAAIIVGSESAGITGVCPEAVIVPLVWSTVDENGATVQGKADMTAQAIYDAIDRYGCRVINISAGTTHEEPALREAVAYAEERGVLVISCAGNKGNTDIYYPGGYETVVCVGACNTKGTEVPSFSNVSGTVDLVAPGLALTLADLQGGTVIASGTSFSCAYVSAAAARLLMEDPTLTAPQLRELLYKTAKDIGPTGYDPQSGWGVLDMEGALARLERAPLALPDVSPEDYYHDAAHWAVEQGILDADEAGGFDPHRPCTQGQVITSLWRASGASEDGAMAWAAARGLVPAGDPAASDPEALCTRAEAVSLLHRLTGGTPAEHSRTLDDVPADAAYVDAVLWAYHRGITAGTGPTTFGPEEPCTRAQFATFLHRFFNGV